MSDTKKLDFPKKFATQIQFQVLIPSTRDKSISISATAFQKRIDTALKFFSKKFGGTTSAYEIGTYMLKGKMIKERVAVITIEATREKYNYYDVIIETWLKEKKKSWGQDSMGFIYQGKMVFV